MKKKQIKQGSKEKRKRQRTNADFFQADWNDDVYIQRTVAKKGKIGGIKLG